MDYEEVIIFFLKKAADIEKEIKMCADEHRKRELVEEQKHYTIAVRCIKEVAEKKTENELGKWIEGKVNQCQR